MATLLLVEDNELNRDMLSRRLRKRGYEVDIAVDGQEGLDRVQSARPDLILMDMSLPVVDGWEATRRLKADPTTSDIPVIALTAHDGAEFRRRSLDAGCDEFETKPLDFECLGAKIDQLLGSGSD